MQTIIKAKRIFKPEPNPITNESMDVRVSDTIIDLTKVQDYEEYNGELKHTYDSKWIDKPMLLLLQEFKHVSDWKVILISFTEFHEIMEKYRVYINKIEGNNKLN
jgi:hypothetical protein